MRTVNKRLLAEIFGVSERTLTTWQKLGMPINSDGIKGTVNEYVVMDCIQWQIDREVEKCRTDPRIDSGERLDPDQQLARLRHHQANKVEIEVQDMRSKLFDAEYVREAMSAMNSEIRSIFMTIPHRVAPKLIKMNSVKEITRALKFEVLQTLKNISEQDSSSQPR